jgi:hypothetical protein
VDDRAADATRVTKTMRPGRPGTLKLMRRYGGALVCVRYREDALGDTRYVTVELVVDAAPVRRRAAGRTLVWVAIAPAERALREAAARRGARWSPIRRMWSMPQHVAESLGLAGAVNRE